MTNAGPGRHDPEIIEGFLRPFEKLVPFPVLTVLLFDVPFERGVAAEKIHRNRVIANEVNGNEGVDQLRVAPKRFHGIAHGREVDDSGNTGKILHEHAAGRNAISRSEVLVLSHCATAKMSSLAIERPSSCRSRFSSSTFMVKGSREMPLRPFFSAVGRL